MAFEISMLEAIVERLGQQALKGGSHVTRQIVALMSASEEKRRAIIDDDIRVWWRYKKQATAQLDAARAKDEPEPESLPHPDDVIISQVTGVTFDGPVLPEDVQRAHEAQHLIKAVLLQEALDLRRDKMKGEPVPTPGCPLMFAIWFNKVALGKRMRFTESDLIDMRMRFRGRSIRTLERLAYQTWKAAKLPVRRGSKDLSNEARLLIMQLTAQGAAILTDKTFSPADQRAEIDRLVQRLFG